MPLDERPNQFRARTYDLDLRPVSRGIASGSQVDVVWAQLLPRRMNREPRTGPVNWVLWWFEVVGQARTVAEARAFRNNAALVIDFVRRAITTQVRRVVPVRRFRLDVRRTHG